MRRRSVVWISLLTFGLLLTLGGVALALQANLGAQALVAATGEGQPAELQAADTSAPLTIEERIAKVQEARDKQVTSEERQAAAARAQEITDAEGPEAAPPVVGPLDQPDYFQSANWAFSPALPKFVDTLASLGTAANHQSNSLGKYIPIAVPDTKTYPGSDYYELSVRQYQQKVHTNLAATTFRGYVQTNMGTNPATGLNTVVPAPIMYLGPQIIVQKDRPVRIKFTNELPVNDAGDLFIPVDRTVMGAGKGPLGDAERDYSDNRAVIHLHGGHNGWISDGTPHQWITPAGENTPYPRGVSTQNVPDMPDPGAGSVTYYFSNDQSARLLFYHDHSWGITRLNVYVGEAAGYLIRDNVENQLIADGIIPSGADEIPLIIQDKTFVQADIIRETDPTWNWGTGVMDGQGIRAPKTGDLWYPHVYLSAQNPYDAAGVNPFGRWHYGPWFWPPTTDTIQPVNNVYYDSANPSLQPPEIPGVPHPSAPGESFFDTPVINGVAYPTMTVEPKPYRLRILNAANDRFWNLQMYVATGIVSGIQVTAPGSGYTQATTTVQITGGGGHGATADAVVDDATGRLIAIDMATVGSGYTSPPTVSIISSENPAGSGATAAAAIHTAPTEVGMIPASPGTGLPANWPVDGRVAGVPDPATKGPDWIQIGTEAGFLAKPAVIETQPITWNNNPTTFNFGNVDQHSLLLGCAERADVIVDFSAYAGRTLIVYNDAPAAFPALDPRYDYYTASPDLSAEGGYWGTQAGYGPNTRTIMQIVVSGGAGQAYNMPALESAFTTTGTYDGVFKRSQDEIIVGQSAYDSTYNTTFPTTYPLWGLARIQDWSMQFKTVTGSTLTMPFQPKALQDEMGEAYDEYGRMSGKLGLQLPNVGPGQQQFVLQNFVDPPTEIVNYSMEAVGPVQGDGTQLWRITHNGVDTHPIHFHLFDVQLINRVGWDGAIRPPDDNELGWKDTIRVSPLEDTFVALRATQTKVPFGLPDSVRPLNPAQPLSSPMGFSQFDPYTGNRLATPTLNAMHNFGWEYVWHCHILSHEEMDMMRPITFNTPRELPAAPVLSALRMTGVINLIWTDGTPVNATSTLGNPAGEIGYRIERAPVTPGGQVGDFTQIATALANQTTFSDTTASPTDEYRYRVIAYNAAGDSPSNIATPIIVPTLTFTAPSGLGSYTSAQSIPVNWTADQDVSAGEFGVWARSAAGTWYIGQLVPTDGTNAYSTDLALTGVPAGWYQVIVGYRPTLGSGTWLSFATSYGFAFSVDAPPTPTLAMTAPVGEASHQAGDTFTATWTASPSLTTGQFAVWVRSADGTGWYWMGPLIPSTGAASYSATVDLTGVAPGLGYQVIVAYEPIANTSLWASWATSPGVFSVGSTAPTITVNQPSGTGSYTSTQSVTADWTTNQNLSGGEFGVWVRTGAGGWYVTTLVPAAGSSGTLYSTALPLSTVPTGSGNEVIVAYRPVAGTGAFMSWAGSPGNFTVTP